MSVNSLSSRDEWTRATFGDRPQMCFFCTNQIYEVAVIWSGCSGTEALAPVIVLHPDCAALLGGELIGDARNAKRIFEGKPLLAGVDKSLLAQGEA